MYLYHENYFAGLSATHLLESPFNLDKSGENSAKFYRHFYLTGGMIFKVNDDLDFRPSVMAKYVLASPINIGLMESFIFFKKFTLGAGVQGGKRIAMKGMDLNFMALIEYKINQKFRVGYNYESGVSALGKRNYGSHEIMLGWDMNFKKARKTTAIIVNASNTYDIQN
jgi:type IX secretion system PorP/SprF family membrane protein